MKRMHYRVSTDSLDGGWTGEHNLCMAVIVRAIQDYWLSVILEAQGKTFDDNNKFSGIHLDDAAKSWLLDSEPDEPYSFDWICGMLQIDAVKLRTRILAGPPTNKLPMPLESVSLAFCKFLRNDRIGSL